MADAVATIQPTCSTASPSYALRRSFIFVLLVGCLLRVAWVGRPLDYRLANAWRECDYTQIARNFYREGMNILYPRIDWRGDTPGYVESEFPLLPWLAAVCDHLFGYREQYLRIFSVLLSLGSLAIFTKIARTMLPPIGALFAVTVFAINPLLVKFASAMQPETLMTFLSLLAFLAIGWWHEKPKPSRLILAAAFIAAATLAKAPAAVLGLVLAYVVLRRIGLRILRQPSLYIALFVAIAPPTLWYLWAKHFWTQYGNSLGLSNESHWIRWHDLKAPMFLLGNLKWETLAVFSPFGWLLALAAPGYRGKRIDFAWAWYAAVWVFYVVAAETSGDDWASYYHRNSVPAACLLMGAGLAALLEGKNQLLAKISTSPRGHTYTKLIATATLLGMIILTGEALYRRDHHPDLYAMHSSAVELAPFIPADSLIVVRGGDRNDQFGHPVAHNEPMFFAWMDRKGFNYAKSDLSLATLNDIASHGGRYWVAHAHELRRDGFQHEVADRYRLVAKSSGGDYFLYDLSSPPIADGAIPKIQTNAATR